MYERISIQNYRGLKELTIERLAPINILIGNNGSGKSTVLEAMWLHSNPAQFLFGRADAFRGFTWDIGTLGQPPAPWQHLFYGYDSEEPIVITGKANDRRWALKLRQATEADNQLLITLQPLGSNQGINPRNTGWLILEVENEHGQLFTTNAIIPIEGKIETNIRPIPRTIPSVNATLLPSPSHALAEMAVRFGRIDRKNNQEGVLKVGRILEPNLKRLTPVPRFDGKSYLYADIGQKELLPIQLMGGGFISALAFAIIAVDMESGLLLIDEIENGIHYSAFESLWKGLWGLHQETGVQIVATTHSQECFEAARAALPKEALLVHRLERDKQIGKVRVATLDAGMLAGAANMGLEVR